MRLEIARRETVVFCLLHVALKVGSGVIEAQKMEQAMGHDAVELVCGPLFVVTCVVPDTVDGDENVSGNPVSTGHGEREDVRVVVVIEVPAIDPEHVVIAAKEVIQFANRLTVLLGNSK